MIFYLLLQIFCVIKVKIITHYNISMRHDMIKNSMLKSLIIINDRIPQLPKVIKECKVKHLIL